MSGELRSRSVIVAAFLIVVLGYVFVLLSLLNAYRREQALAPQVVQAEQAVAAGQAGLSSNADVLRSDIATARERLSALRGRVPGSVQVNSLFDRVAQSAQQSGVTDFRFQRRAEAQQNMRAGVYRVYRFSISGRGTPDKVAAFLDAAQQDAGPTMVLENISLTPNGADWLLNADMTIYTLGG